MEESDDAYSLISTAVMIDGADGAPFIRTSTMLMHSSVTDNPRNDNEV